MTEAPVRTEGRWDRLRWLTDQYMGVQKLRVGNSNRVFASTEGLDTNNPDPFLVEIIDDLEGLEKSIFRQMKRTLEGSRHRVVVDGVIVEGTPPHPAWPWLNGIKGIGPTLGAKILGLIGDIERSKSISDLWSFAGYGLVEQEDGSFKRQRPVKGQKLNYNKRLKTAVYLAGDSFIKSRSPYRDIYDEAKAFYRLRKQIQPIFRILRPDIEIEELQVLRETVSGKREWDRMIREANKKAGAKNDEACWSDGHVDNAARRKMVKRFLAHLWLVWREAEGLPTRNPYVIDSPDHPEHEHVDPPWNYSG